MSVCSIITLDLFLLFLCAVARTKRSMQESTKTSHTEYCDCLRMVVVKSCIADFASYRMDVSHLAHHNRTTNPPRHPISLRLVM